LELSVGSFQLPAFYWVAASGDGDLPFVATSAVGCGKNFKLEVFAAPMFNFFQTGEVGLPFEVLGEMEPARLFPILGLLIALPASAQSPSFDCAKARLPDEKAVCSDEKLAQLDVTIATGLKQVSADQAKSAREDAITGLTDRHACGSNKVCILDNQAALISTLEDYGAKVSLPPWIGSYRLTLLDESGAQFVNGLPTKVGACTKTKIGKITTRFGDPLKPPGPNEFDPGSAVEFADNGFQTSYSYNEALEASAVGDEVVLCLVSIPRNCPAGDDRGKVYSATNLRTKGSWIMPDSQHMCGGA
jgi:uncharacterized protein